jgi:hypothetical protein
LFNLYYKILGAMALSKTGELNSMLNFIPVPYIGALSQYKFPLTDVISQVVI